MKTASAVNQSAKVGRFPQPGTAVPETVRREFARERDLIKDTLDQASKRPKPPTDDLMADALVYQKAVRDALRHDEFFEENDLVLESAEVIVVLRA